MTNVLHRTHRPSVGERLLPSATDFGPPSWLPPEPELGPGSPTRRPDGTKALVALLAVGAMLAATSAVIVFASRDDGSTERALQEQVVSITAERDKALDSVRALEVELATAREQVGAALADNDRLNVSIDQLEARIAALTVERAGALATAEELTATIDELTTAGATLEASLASAEQRLTTITAERDAFTKLFPIKFDASLSAAATVGTYDVRLSQVFCTGLASCGKAPTLGDLRISTNSQGHLRLNIPKFVEGGLFDADGALHMVSESTTAVPSCGGTARTARVAATIFPGGYQIATDGTRTQTGLNAVITVEAPAVGSCAVALAFYSVDLSAH